MFVDVLMETMGVSLEGVNESPGKGVCFGILGVGGNCFIGGPCI